MLADLFFMKCLVTGGAGFIGSHLVGALHERADEVVVVLDNFSTGLEANLPEGVAVARGDAGDRALLEDILPGCDTIFHLAAISSVQASMDHPLRVHGDNLTATLALLEAARKHKVKRFVFSSSAAVYGDTHGKPAQETMKPDPQSHYAVQKLAGEHYCQVYARLYGLETVSLRYFNIFGPRQRADSPYSGVIARFLEPAGDVVGGVFNIGSGHSVSICDVVDTIRGIFPAMPATRNAPAREGEIAHSRADISHARQILDYRPSVSFTEALRKLASDCS